MIIDFSLSIRNNRLSQIKNAIDAGSGTGKLKYYTGTKPAVGATITDQVLIGTHLFTDSCRNCFQCGIDLYIFKQW